MAAAITPEQRAEAWRQAVTWLTNPDRPRHYLLGFDLGSGDYTAYVRMPRILRRPHTDDMRQMLDDFEGHRT